MFEGVQTIKLVSSTYGFATLYYCTFLSSKPLNRLLCRGFFLFERVVCQVKKMCGDCERILDLETGFHKDPQSVDGHCYYCKTCKNERGQWAYDLHKEKKKKYNMENKEKIKQYRKEYYEKNKKEILLWQKNYYERNKYKYQENYLKKKGEEIGETNK